MELELKQKQYIKDNWGKIGQQQIMKNLNIGYKKLKRYALELSLSNQHESPIKEALDNDKIKYIKKNYKKLGAKTIAKNLNCNESTIYKYAKTLKLTKTCIPWSDIEDEIIKENFNRITLAHLRIILRKAGYKRTELAIKKRIKDLKLKKDITDNGFYYTSKELSNIMGFGTCKINVLIRKGYLKGEKYKRKTRIDLDSIKDFMYNYQQYWNYNDVDKELFNLIFTDLNHEQWLLDKIRKDLSIDKKNRKDWTTSQIEYLKYLIDKNVDTKTICVSFSKDRSKIAVISKIYELKNAYKKEQKEIRRNKINRLKRRTKRNRKNLKYKRLRRFRKNSVKYKNKNRKLVF